MPRIVVVSYSELDTFRQCPLKHLWAYKQRWKKDPGEDSPLTKGSAWHLMMETHYGVLRTHPGALDEAREAVLPLIADDPNRDLLEWMYDGYVEHWGTDPDFKTLGLEIPFQVPLPTPEGKPSHYHIKGKIDRLMRSKRTGGLWIEDHKSCSNLPTEFELQLDDQFGLYTWVLRELGHPVMGSVHSAARTTRNVGDFPNPPKGKRPQRLDQRFNRTYLNRTDRELDNIARDAYAAARNAYPPKGKELPLYSSPDPRQCGWKCDYKEAHLMAREGIDPKRALKTLGFEQNFERH